MRRIYFLLPGVATAKNVVDELLLARVGIRHIHVIAKAGTALEDLPEASIAQTSDLIPGLERGLAAGGATGILAGIIAVTFPPAGLVLGGGAVLATGLAGAGFGGLLSSMVGAGMHSSRLKRFQGAIEQGQILMLVDIPKQRVEEIEALVKKHHPDADIEGTEPTIPAFP
ncbi:MAG TPA: DUF1269 domain-containing protein [Gammaproteobacteria bacterium]|nr:DUF1269 domain-containing protein [Gammaproteobacteria bacterium]